MQITNNITYRNNLSTTKSNKSIYNCNQNNYNTSFNGKLVKISGKIKTLAMIPMFFSAISLPENANASTSKDSSISIPMKELQQKCDMLKKDGVVTEAEYNHFKYCVWNKQNNSVITYQQAQEALGWIDTTTIVKTPGAKNEIPMRELQQKCDMLKKDGVVTEAEYNHFKYCVWNKQNNSVITYQQAQEALGWIDATQINKTTNTTAVVSNNKKDEVKKVTPALSSPIQKSMPTVQQDETVVAIKEPMEELKELSDDIQKDGIVTEAEYFYFKNTVHDKLIKSEITIKQALKALSRAKSHSSIKTANTIPVIQKDNIAVAGKESSKDPMKELKELSDDIQKDGIVTEAEYFYFKNAVQDKQSKSEITYKQAQEAWRWVNAPSYTKTTETTPVASKDTLTSDTVTHKKANDKQENKDDDTSILTILASLIGVGGGITALIMLEHRSSGGLWSQIEAQRLKREKAQLKREEKEHRKQEAQQQKEDARLRKQRAIQQQQEEKIRQEEAQIVLNETYAKTQLNSLFKNEDYYVIAPYLRALGKDILPNVQERLFNEKQDNDEDSLLCKFISCTALNKDNKKEFKEVLKRINKLSINYNQTDKNGISVFEHIMNSENPLLLNHVVKKGVKFTYNPNLDLAYKNIEDKEFKALLDEHKYELVEFKDVADARKSQDTDAIQSVQAQMASPFFDINKFID